MAKLNTGDAIFMERCQQDIYIYIYILKREWNRTRNRSWFPLERQTWRPCTTKACIWQEIYCWPWKKHISGYSVCTEIQIFLLCLCIIQIMSLDKCERLSNATKINLCSTTQILCTWFEFCWVLLRLCAILFSKFPVHDDVNKWKHFPCYWPFVRGTHWSPVNSPHKGQWH